MTGPLPHLEAIFPALAAAGYSPKSEKSPVYNCIAYAAGDEGRRWRDIEKQVTTGRAVPRKGTRVRRKPCRYRLRGREGQGHEGERMAEARVAESGGGRQFVRNRDVPGL